VRQHCSNIHCDAAMPEGLFEKFSAALVAALATPFVAVFAEWLRQRGGSSRTKRDTDQAVSRINFLSAWLGLQERLAESEAESARIVIAQELEDIRRQAEQTWARAKGPRRPVARQGLRTLLLLGAGKSVYIQILRGLYWIVLAWFVLLIVPSFFINLAYDVTTSSNESFTYWLAWGAAALLNTFVVPVGVMLLLRYLIRRRQRRIESEQSEQLRPADQRADHNHGDQDFSDTPALPVVMAQAETPVNDEVSSQNPHALPAPAPPGVAPAREQ
jgi:hypothetical protein